MKKEGWNDELCDSLLALEARLDELNDARTRFDVAKRNHEALLVSILPPGFEIRRVDCRWDRGIRDAYYSLFYGNSEVLSYSVTDQEAKRKLADKALELHKFLSILK